jgi:hypothetical protein
MKITRKQLRKLITESIEGSESYPVNFPPHLKKPGMRAISIYQQPGPDGYLFTFIQNSDFSAPEFTQMFSDILSVYETHIEIPEPPRSPNGTRLVVKQKRYDNSFGQNHYSENEDLVGEVLNLLRTPRPGFAPFTHIIDIQDLYDGSYVGELNDAAIQRYSPGWSPDIEEDSFSDEFI